MAQPIRKVQKSIELYDSITNSFQPETNFDQSKIIETEYVRPNRP